MGDYTQAGRKGRITGLLGEDDFLLRGFDGVDALSQLFCFRLELLAETKLRVPFEKVLGKRATVHLALPDGSEHHLNGLCVRFTQGARSQEFTHYRAELVPDAWLLTRRTRSRVFQHEPVPDILKKVLAGVEVRWDLHGRYEPRDYCVQYRESDLAFASRLMEEEGIFFFFDHADGSHTMVVGDTPGVHPPVPHGSRFVYEELEGGHRDDDRVYWWEKTQEVRSTRVLLWDHTFELPHKHLESESIILDSVKVGEETHKLRLPGTDALELYDWPGGYAQRFDGISKGGGEQPAELQKVFADGKRTVELRMDEETVPAVVATGRSNVKQLVAGHKLELARHFSADGEYVLLSVRHQATYAADVRAEGAAPDSYANTFTCMPAALKYRPPRLTPRPVVRGCQTAVVVGPAGEEIFCDRYGRVKVQFHWDREGAGNEDSSCWIRVGTHWAGKQWGAIHIPRVGQEVIVDFVEGDPDQPIIVGSVYNADQMPPYALPDHKTQSGIKSRSTLKGTPANFNEIRFEDKRGEEELYVQAERNLTTLVKKDEGHTVQGNRGSGIGGNDSRGVGRDDSHTVQGKQVNTVGTDRTSSVGTNDTVRVGANEAHQVGATFSVEAETIVLSARSRVVISVGGTRIELTGDQLLGEASQVELHASALTALASGVARLVGGETQVQGASSVEVASMGPVTVTGMPIKLNA